MKYEDFKIKVTEKLAEYYGSDATVELRQVKKNNCVCDGIQIRMNKDKIEISPIIYLNDFYKDFENNEIEDIDGVVESIASIYDKHSHIGKELFGNILSNFEDWSNIKDNVYPMLVPMKNNSEFLSGLVHKEFLDFAIIYYISGINAQEDTYSIKISHPMLEKYGISLDELDAQARKNNSSDKYSVASMFETLFKICSKKEENEFDPSEIGGESDKMYIISSDSIHYGAAGILNPEVLTEAEKHVGKRFYILPSSIYEVIITADEGNLSTDDLNNMVVSVNEESLQDQDILSDHVYYYNAGEITIAA